MPVCPSLPGVDEGATVVTASVSLSTDYAVNMYEDTATLTATDDDTAEADLVWSLAGGADHELRPREEFPWFWSWLGDGPQGGCTDFPGGTDFDGNRWNDLHYASAKKSAARERKREWATTRKYARERMDDVHMAATRERSVRRRPDLWLRVESLNGSNTPPQSACFSCRTRYDRWRGPRE